MPRKWVETVSLRSVILFTTIPFIWIVFHFLSGGSVLTAGNLVNLFKYVSVVAMLSVGMTYVIASGQIDLSVGSGLGMLGAVTAYFLQALQWPLIAALMAGMIAGLLAWGILGMVIAFLKVPAFIVTLSGLMAFMGIKQILANPVIPIFNEQYLFLGQGHLSGTAGLFMLLFFALLWILIRFAPVATIKEIFPDRKNIVLPMLVFLLLLLLVLVCNADRGVPVSLVVLLITAAIYDFIGKKTAFGRHLYAVGSNLQAVRYTGINVERVLVPVFLLMAICVFLAGSMATTQLMAAAPDIGEYQELYAIAACVVGGTSLKGGKGSVWMSILGALLMSSIVNGMEQTGITSTIQKIILGVILTSAVALDQLRFSRSKLF